MVCVGVVVWVGVVEAVEAVGVVVVEVEEVGDLWIVAVSVLLQGEQGEH